MLGTKNRTSARPAGRCLAAVGLIAALTWVAAPWAGAVTTPAADASWFWAGQIPGAVDSGTPAGIVGTPAPLPTPDVPADDLPVQAFGGQSQRETFLHLDLAFEAASHVDRAVLVLHEDAAAQGNLATDTATVEAVPVADFFSGGDVAKPYANRPAVAAAPAVVGTRAPDGTWTFDLAPIAQAWANQSLANNGIALRVLTGSTASFQVIWRGIATAEAPVLDAVIVANPPVTEVGPTVPSSPVSDPLVSAPTDPLAGGSGGAGTVGDPGSVGGPPSGVGSTGGLVPATVSSPSRTTSPVPASTGQGSGVRRTILASAGRSDHGLSPLVVLAGLAIAALAMAGALALGPAGEPDSAAGEGRQGPVMRRLGQRLTR